MTFEGKDDGSKPRQTPYLGKLLRTSSLKKGVVSQKPTTAYCSSLVDCVTEQPTVTSVSVYTGRSGQLPTSVRRTEL